MKDLPREAYLEHRHVNINGHDENEHCEKQKASQRTSFNYSRSKNKEGCDSLLIGGVIWTDSAGKQNYLPYLYASIFPIKKKAFELERVGQHSKGETGDQERTD